MFFPIRLTIFPPPWRSESHVCPGPDHGIGVALRCDLFSPPSPTFVAIQILGSPTALSIQLAFFDNTEKVEQTLGMIASKPLFSAKPHREIRVVNVDGFAITNVFKV
jgi:hypothetical protein